MEVCEIKTALLSIISHAFVFIFPPCNRKCRRVQHEEHFVLCYSRSAVVLLFSQLSACKCLFTLSAFCWQRCTSLRIKPSACLPSRSVSQSGVIWVCWQMDAHALQQVGCRPSQAGLGGQGLQEIGDQVEIHIQRLNLLLFPLSARMCFRDFGWPCFLVFLLGSRIHIQLMKMEFNINKEVVEKMVCFYIFTGVWRTKPRILTFSDGMKLFPMFVPLSSWSIWSM